MGNKFKYRGRQPKMRENDVSLVDISRENMAELESANRKTMYGRGAVYSAVGAIAGPPGIAVGAGLAFVQAEKKRYKRLEEYEENENELGNMINNEMDQLEEGDY